MLVEKVNSVLQEFLTENHRVPVTNHMILGLMTTLLPVLRPYEITAVKEDKGEKTTLPNSVSDGGS